MSLAGLANHEGIQAPSGRCRGVQHRRRHGVCAQGEPADSIEVEALGHLVHDQTHQGSGLAVEGDASQVDVVVGFPS